MLRLCMLALAFAVLLQALPRGPIGSRRLAPSIFTGIYLAPSILAVKLGGLPLVWGMTIFAGLCEAVLAQFWVRLRTLIPPESAGMVVFLVGVIIGLAALRLLVGDGPGGSVAGRDAIVTGCTLAVTIGAQHLEQGAAAAVLHPDRHGVRLYRRRRGRLARRARCRGRGDRSAALLAVPSRSRIFHGRSIAR